MTRALRRRLGTLVALSALLASGLSASAGAAGAGLGDATTADGSAECDNPDGLGYTYLQTGASGGVYVVPADGIITGWQFGTPAEGAPTTVGFRLGRGSGTTYSVVGASVDVAVTPGVRVDQQVRIPARAGDLLGLFAAGPNGNSRCLRSTAADTDVIAYAPGNVTSGAFAVEDVASTYRLAVAATLEPDADADGYGDLTQDLCPTEATTQGVCPAPETKAGKATIKKLVKGKRQVTVAFTASKPGGTFQCALDSTKKFKACTSPYRAKLKVGKHVLRIRSVGANGAIEKTPAVVRITIKG